MRLAIFNTKNSTTVINAVCAIVFCLFTFVYLYFYQADILTMAQHVLSGGATHYNKLVGAVLITVVLFLLQMGIRALTGLRGCRLALTYFPSALALAIVTSVGSNIDLHFSFGVWTWLLPLLLIVWGFGVYAGIKIPYGPRSAGASFPHALWVNVLSLCGMFLFVGVASNSNDVFHYRMRIEHCLMDADYEQAVKVGEWSLATDENLTMLRAYALAREGLLGEKLFTYPVSGSSADLVPMPKGTRCMMYPVDSLYVFLGARPLSTQDTKAYLYALLKGHKATPIVKDYILCGYLIDRNLDAFAAQLPLFYHVSDNLPRHYREALTLYTHLRSNPRVVYHNNVMDTDFSDLQAIEKQYPQMDERRKAVGEQYAGTYWWYYEYGK